MGNRKKVLKNEQRFHDNWAAVVDPEKINEKAAFEGATAPENRFFLRHLHIVRGMRILDLGCGQGEASLYFSNLGARCVSTDYSPGMVRLTLHTADERARHVLGGVVNDATHLPFGDGAFDLVYVSNLLHHVDSAVALEELYRVLKPGGKACIWDPLKHNPVVAIYRRMATMVRTKHEHPLDISFVRLVEEKFSKVKWDTFWFFTQWIFIQFFIFEGVHPNRERYWKKILYEEPRLRNWYYRLERLDNLVKRVPFIKRFGWNLAILAEK